MRDFLDLDDALRRLPGRPRSRRPPPAPTTWRAGRGTRIRELDALLALSDLRPEIRVGRARWRPADAMAGSAARLTATSGWRPRRAFAATLRALLDGWRAALAADAAEDQP